MLVPEAKQALEWLRQVSDKLSQTEDAKLTEQEIKLLRNVNDCLNGAREDCEQTLDALDALGRGQSGMSNPISDLVSALRSKKAPTAKDVKDKLDSAITALSEYDD